MLHRRNGCSPSLKEEPPERSRVLESLVGRRGAGDWKLTGRDPIISQLSDGMSTSKILFHTLRLSKELMSSKKKRKLSDLILSQYLLAPARLHLIFLDCLQYSKIHNKVYVLGCS